MEILKLFPVPVLKTKIPRRYSELVSILDNQPLATNRKNTKLYGNISENTYILDLPELVELKTHILDVIENFSENNLNYAPNITYRFTQSWLSIKNPGESHNLHHHPNSVISGVFYYGEFTKGVSNIYFENFQEPSRTASICVPQQPSTIEEFSNTRHIFTPPGTLLLFPSWLKHGVPENITTNPRKSLSFNSIPKDRLGNPINLTELKF